MESPLIIQIVWSVSVLFVTIIMMLIFYLRFLRKTLRKNQRIIKVYKEKYESYLLNYLYSGKEEVSITSQQQLIINQLKKSSKNPYKRKILISSFIKLKNEISGEIATSIQQLYFQIELVDYALAKVKNKKWYFIANGIRELNQFHVKSAHDEVIVHINHPRREVRKEMQLYMVNLFYFEGLKFLDVLEMQLSEWDQIQLLGVLQRLENQNVSNINSWLESSNNSVIIFALKLAEFYNQIESKDDLLKLLYHIDKKIRIEAIRVLSYLEVLEAKEILKFHIENRCIEEQIAFFKMMENLYENTDESFLLAYANHEIFEIKVSILKILKVFNKERFIQIKNESSDVQFYKIANFIENN